MKFRIFNNEQLEEYILRWFNSAVYFSLIIALTYVLLHVFCKTPREQIKFLNTDQVDAVRTILGEHDTTLSIAQQDLVNFERVVMYLTHVLDVDDTAIVKDRIQIYSLESLPTLLSSIPFKVGSSFWLHGPMQYWEIVFWSIFGVIASIIYYGAEAIGRSEFDRNKIPGHIAKLVYAPISSLVIIFSFSLFVANGSIITTGISNAILVIAFILGFFSGRTVEFLNRLKNLVLPLGNDSVEGVPNSTSELQGSITGKIEVLDGSSPLEIEPKDIAIILQSSDDPSKITFTTNPDSNLNFEFKEIAPGHYWLMAEYVEKNTDLNKARAFRAERDLIVKDTDRVIKEDLTLKQITVAY
ncbi:MAG: hypothetical protein IPP15_13825 [Saprospiraceae bacterium]|uniref:Uncharacterized protein n=1 Tax=Candidatus Opimibacter skivensis TaxID=2982028 RepID=A0A9D7XU78_9BACT|nr:hypothetical protein [Candidatus Opimibacter skivensis]